MSFSFCCIFLCNFHFDPLCFLAFVESFSSCYFHFLSLSCQFYLVSYFTKFLSFYCVFCVIFCFLSHLLHNCDLNHFCFVAIFWVTFILLCHFFNLLCHFRFVVFTCAIFISIIFALLPLSHRIHLVLFLFPFMSFSSTFMWLLCHFHFVTSFVSPFRFVASLSSALFSSYFFFTLFYI